MHRIFTCKNHLNLRWSTKQQAVYNGRYTGERNIFFQGEITNPVEYYKDGSGINCNPCPECACSADSLILAPEDRVLFPNSDEYTSPI